MVQDEQRININIRNCSPCKGCTERFSACSDRCPKSARGEYGYNEWKAEIQRVNLERKRYMDSRLDDSKKRRERWVIGK